MESKPLSSFALAASAAALFLAGCANTGTGSHSGTEARLACDGANACKGHSECKTANSACKGQNACKGQGFVMLTADQCEAVTGRS